jgi:ATP-dependent Clp protease protease subunit
MSTSGDPRWPGGGGPGPAIGPFREQPVDRIRTRLFERRVISLQGVLDDRLASQVAAELMMLDGSGDGSVGLLVDSGDGTLQAAFTVMDTIDLLGVPVHATCIGRADGPAVGVVAVSHHRRASPHARFGLRAPRTEIAGSAADLERWAGHHLAQLDSFVARLAQATRQPAEHLEADLYAGRYLSAEEALAYGLVDEIWSTGGHDSRRPLGYGS